MPALPLLQHHLRTDRPGQPGSLPMARYALHVSSSCLEALPLPDHKIIPAIRRFLRLSTAYR